jgi:hypothetical protein
VSSIPKLTFALLSLSLIILIGGCVKHPNARERERRPMSYGQDIVAADEAPEPPPELPPALPGDRIITSATTPTTSRYLDTQPTAFPQTRIVLLVADRGVIRRQWPLAVSPRPSGDTLAGPYYWPSTDEAVRRKNKINVWLEPLEFVYNTALLPFRAIATPPWSKMVYSPDGGLRWRNVEQAGVLFQERE